MYVHPTHKLVRRQLLLATSEGLGTSVRVHDLAELAINSAPSFRCLPTPVGARRAGAPCLCRNDACLSRTQRTQSLSTPPSLVPPKVDLVIVDFGVNDAVIERVDFNLEYIRMAHEILVRHARNDMSSSPALLYAEGYIPPSHLAGTPWQSGNMAEVHAEVTRKYDIPMVRARGPQGRRFLSLLLLLRAGDIALGWVRLGGCVSGWVGSARW